MRSNTYMSIEKEAADYTPCKRSQFSTTPGIWMEGIMYWINNGYEKLISSQAISIHIKEDSIHSKIRLYNVYVKNHCDREKNIKILFMNRHHEVATEHLSFVSPMEKVIFHLVGKEMYLVNGFSNEECTIQQTVHSLWNIPTEHIWADQKKGILKYQPMGKGASASIFSLDLNVPANQTRKVSAWVVQGVDKQVLLQMNETIIKKHTSISK